MIKKNIRFETHKGRSFSVSYLLTTEPGC